MTQPLATRRLPAKTFWGRALRHRSFVLGGALSLLVLASALLSLVWTPWSPYEIDIASKLRPPSAEHWLGTDSFGRDIVSLLLAGARSTIMVGIIAVSIGLTFGVCLGLIASAKRGWTEEIIMRFSDFTFAFPAVLSAIMLAAVAGPGMLTSIIAIGIFQIPTLTRLTRGSANAIWAREFVLAARASGKGKFRITIEHVLPNILSILIVQVTIQFALAILAEAALVLSRPRHAAAAAVLGPHAERRADLAVPVADACGLSGCGDRNRRARPQSARRRIARPARSPAGAGAMTMADPATAPLIEVSNLGVRLNTSRGPAQAVRGVSFALKRGETLGLVGESGCGKSVTAMSLMGLLPDSAVITGSIRLDGNELAGLADADYCKLRGNRISMIFQEPMTALNPMHTIGHQVAEPLRRHKKYSAAQARREAIALLDRVGLPDPAKRIDAYPHQFSGGQRQRVTIAMALACEPDLLIADEPTTALDVTIQGQILDLIADLVEERGMSMILISHDLGVIAENVQRMMVMYGGTVVESGPTDEVFRRMGHPYTQGLFRARPKLGARKGTRLTTISGTVPELADLPPGCAFGERCPLVEDKCRAALPPMVEVGPSHVVRCVRTDVSMAANVGALSA